MEQTEKKPQSGILFLICAAALWSTAGVLTKFNPWSGTTIACLRGILAALTQILLTKTFRFKLNRTIVLTALCYFGETFLFMIANKLTSAGSAIVHHSLSVLVLPPKAQPSGLRGGRDDLWRHSAEHGRHAVFR